MGMKKNKIKKKTRRAYKGYVFVQLLFNQEVLPFEQWIKEQS